MTWPDFCFYWVSPVTTIFTITFACLCPTTLHALFLPASHFCYGWQGPREWSQAPSGEFPLCSALYLLTTHHHHLLPHHQPSKCSPWQSQGTPPTLAASIQPHTHRFKCDKNWPTVPWQMQPLPTSQSPPNKHIPQITTIHENAHKTAWWPTKLPIYPWQQPSTQNKPPMLMELAHKNAPTDGIQHWSPLTRTQCRLANQQGIQYPPCSQVDSPHLPLTRPEWQQKHQRPLQQGHHCIPLNHGHQDHMLTPRPAETLPSLVRIFGGYILGSWCCPLS